MTMPTRRPLKRHPTFTTDADGTPVASIPLAKGQTATLETTDWEDLLCRGVSPHWTFNHNGNGLSYVRVKSPLNLLSVGRLILGARRGQIVRYRNGDRCDLRRLNIHLESCIKVA